MDDEFEVMLAALSRRPQLANTGMDDEVRKRGNQIDERVDAMVAASGSGPHDRPAEAPVECGVIPRSGAQTQIALTLLWLHCRRLHQETTVDSGLPGAGGDQVLLVDLPDAHQAGLRAAVTDSSIIEWALRLRKDRDAVTAHLPTSVDEPDSARIRRAGQMLLALSRFQRSLSGFMAACDQDVVACTLRVLREDSAGGAGRG